MGSCAAPSAKGDDKFITTDYLQQCLFEIPFLLVGTFKYISSAFNPRLSATLFLIGFNLSKQLSGVVLSAWVGRMYDTVGFHQAYLILGCITLSFTLLSFVTLRGGNRLLPTAETQSPA
ncbi:MFS transporter [Escherichia coli]|nr:MFS transporter [Escherichia coli]